MAPERLQNYVGGAVTVRGTGFVPGSTSVSFNSVGASIITATATRVDVIVRVNEAKK